MAEGLRERYLPALDAVRAAARPGETSAGWLAAERSDFVRFNRGRVRQCGSVERATLELRLIEGDRQARRIVTLCGVAGEDRARVSAGFDWLRAALVRSGPDPWLCFSPAPSASLAQESARLPGADEAIDAVRSAAGDADLVGFHAGGPLARGFASSLGHAHWHEADAWFFDHSIHVGEGRAVKATLAGGDWSAQRVDRSVREALAQAALLRRPARQLATGSYRSFLSPAAVAELLGLLAWDGFSARAHRSGHASLARLRSGAAALDARVRIAEDLAQARVPRFQADGFTRPARMELVDGGRFAGWLVSPRSGREFGLEDNGAADAECPEALSMAGGGLPGAQALARLGTGVAIGNLWYLNFSDREACRITGMTRFASFWVEDGEAVAPIAPMRFDDSVYRILGEALEELTAEAVAIPDTDSYEGRRSGSITAPGALLSGLALTL